MSVALAPVLGGAAPLFPWLGGRHWPFQLIRTLPLVLRYYHIFHRFQWLNCQNCCHCKKGRIGFFCALSSLDACLDSTRVQNARRSYACQMMATTRAARASEPR